MENVREKKSIYLVSWYIDALLIGGISLLAFCYFRFFFQTYSNFQTSYETVVFTSVAIWFVNFPHFAASSYRLYQNKERRDQFFFTAYLLPFLMLALTIVAFLSPQLFAPYFVKAFTLWSPYHYGAQNAGFAILYARRTGFELNKTERLSLFTFMACAFLYQFSEMEMLIGSGSFRDVSLPSIPFPHWSPLFFKCCSFACLLSLVFSLGKKSFQQKRFVHWTILLPIATHYVWFIGGGLVFSFQTLVPLFHGIQYLFLAWTVELFEAGATKSMLKHSFRWATWNIALGILLFYGLPKAATLLGFNYGFASVVLLATVQVHHFIVDGVIWKTKGKTENSLNQASLENPEPSFTDKAA